MQLTLHFNSSDFEYSSTAIAQGIDNKIPSALIPNLITLCREVLEPLREHAQEPVFISSGYRCPQLNKAVGGSSTSQHMTGEACDIHLSDQKKLLEWFTWLKDNTNFDQLILERTVHESSSINQNHYWIHVSCRSDPRSNRHQVKQIIKA